MAENLEQGGFTLARQRDRHWGYVMHPGPVAFEGPAAVPRGRRRCQARLTGTPGRIDWLGPPLGSHTECVLNDWIGLGPGEIAGLRKAGAI